MLTWQLGRDRFGFWRVEGISLDDAALPEAEVHGPHPRLPPEAVVAAQLRQLHDGEAEAAEAFVVRCGTERPPAGSGLLDSAAGKALVRLLSSEGVSSEVGRGALPTQRRFLQEVIVTVRPQEGYQPLCPHAAAGPVFPQQQPPPPPYPTPPTPSDTHTHTHTQSSVAFRLSSSLPVPPPPPPPQHTHTHTQRCGPQAPLSLPPLPLSSVTIPSYFAAVPISLSLSLSLSLFVWSWERSVP